MILAVLLLAPQDTVASCGGCYVRQFGNSSYEGDCQGYNGTVMNLTSGTFVTAEAYCISGSSTAFPAVPMGSISVTLKVYIATTRVSEEQLAWRCK